MNSPELPPGPGPGIKDERGNRYGSLVVIGYEGTKGDGAHWCCVCDCGNSRIVRGVQLRQGKAIHCGCGLGGVRRGGPNRLRDAFILIGKPPCERGCVFMGKCAAEDLACKQFRFWHQTGGEVLPAPEKFPPNEKIYTKLFPDG